MLLMKEGLWSIVNGTEAAPGEDQAERLAKFVAIRDRALAMIVLSVDPTLLYLLGDPEDPVTVWKKLSDQFQKKTWANKLELRRRLYSLRLKEGDSVQEHIRRMTEVFEELAVIGDLVKEEDRVVHLLASLPESYNMLVTALEANPDVPQMEVVTERLLHEERKQMDKESSGSSTSKALTIARSKAVLTCFHCGKPGHFKRNCRLLAKDDRKPKQFRRNKNSHPKANKASARRDSDSENEALVVEHVLQAGTMGNWIVDSGATCHMCSRRKLFSELHPLKQQTDMTLGDGHTLKVGGRGTVSLKMKLSDSSTRKCKLLDVLHVPGLSYNLLSVSKAAENGKVTKFNEDGCKILNSDNKLIAKANKVGSLYYLDCEVDEQATVARNESKESLWHRRYGHLGTQSLRKLARDDLVSGLDCNFSNEVSFCEACIEGKHKKTPFEAGGRNRSAEPLALVHSDLCGKMNARSFGGEEYFITFIDDSTHYTWVYPLKRKSDAFNQFLKWKALAENSSGRRLKVLRTDRGGEYTSTEFEEFLESAGIRHERTIPKTPQQNGVSERMNRTLVESVRSMLVDAKLPHEFWAEALSTAVYLRNRSPTKAVDGMTPFEAWVKKKPSVSHLQRFRLQGLCSRAER